MEAEAAKPEVQAHEQPEKTGGWVGEWVGEVETEDQ